MAHPTELDALYALLVAAAVTALLTPVTMRLARRLGMIDEPRERGLSDRPTPLLGGLAIFGGVLVAGADVPAQRLRRRTPPVARRAARRGDHHGSSARSTTASICHPPLKLAGQVLAAVVVVHFGVA